MRKLIEAHCREALLEPIYDQGLRVFIDNALQHHWTYLWMPSTKGGRYHPADEYKPLGLYLHVRRVQRVLQHLIRSDDGKHETRSQAKMPHELTIEERDVLHAAVIIHDLNKITTSGSAAVGPALLMQELARQYGRGWGRNYWWAEQLLELVAVHGGAFYDATHTPHRDYVYDWNNRLHQYMHLADFIASRNDITVHVDRAFDQKHKRRPLRKLVMDRLIVWLVARRVT
jgi:hypothetical protein